MRLRIFRSCDFVVLAVPARPELIGAAEIACMKRHAFLINIAEDKVVVEAELIKALPAGTIAGAMLDVFEREPRAEDSPLWDGDRLTCSSSSRAALSKKSRHQTFLASNGSFPGSANSAIRCAIQRRIDHPAVQFKIYQAAAYVVFGHRPGRSRRLCGHFCPVLER